MAGITAELKQELQENAKLMKAEKSPEQSAGVIQKVDDTGGRLAGVNDQLVLQYQMMQKQQQNKLIIICGSIGLFSVISVLSFGWLIMQSLPNAQASKAIEAASTTAIAATQGANRPNIDINCSWSLGCQDMLRDADRLIAKSGYETSNVVPIAPVAPGSPQPAPGSPLDSIPVKDPQYYQLWFNHFQQIALSDRQAFQSLDLIRYQQHTDILKAHQAVQQTIQ